MLLLARIILGWMVICIYDVMATITPCTDNHTETSCIQNLSTFTYLDKPRFVSGPELDRLCRKAEIGQRCSSEFIQTSTCVDFQEQILQLRINRSQGVFELLCDINGNAVDPEFRKEYLKHSVCIEDNQKKIKECYLSANMIEDPELEIVRNSSKTSQELHMSACCPVVQYIECSANAIGVSCGTESQNVVLRVLLTAAGKKLEEFCINIDQKFPNSPGACVSSANHLLSPSVLNFALFFIMCIFSIVY